MKDFDYPYKRMGKRSPLSKGEELALFRAQTQSKTSVHKIKLGKAFIEQQKSSFKDDNNLHDERVSKILHAHMERKSSSKAVLEQTAKNALRAPAKQNLRRMQSISNEIGRKRGGGKLLHEMLTQDMVNQLIKGSHKK